MSRQRPDDAEAEVGRVLRQASGGYADLPAEVGQRLDRVLQTLPAADTLHGAADTPAREGLFERWVERLRPRRVRYALLSAAAAVLVTVGGVGIAVQFVNAPKGNDDASAAQDLYESPERSDGGEDEGAAPEAADEDDEVMSGESGPLEDEGLIPGVATFATGSDYGSGTDLLTALRELGADSATGAIPEELADLAAGGEFWQRCAEAIGEEYGSLLLAVDFARYESEPAVMALLISDSGETAVALTPACADGVVEPLAVQS